MSSPDRGMSNQSVSLSNGLKRPIPFKSSKPVQLEDDTLQALLDARTAQLQQLTSTLMTLQDEERRRIARELHDSAGQDLAAIEMNLHLLMREGSPRTPNEVSYLSDALEAVRH